MFVKRSCLTASKDRTHSFSRRFKNRPFATEAVACRGLVTPGATAWLDAPVKFQYWAVAYGSHCYWIYAVCNVTIWRHIHVCKPTFWRTQHAYYSTRTLLTRCCTICHCNERKYQRSKLGGRSKTQHSTLRQSRS